MIKLLPDSCYSHQALPKVELIVIHAMAATKGPTVPDPYSLQANYDLLAQSQTAVHYLIGREEGEAWQLVPYNLPARHAPESAWQNHPSADAVSLSVALIGSPELNSYTDWQYETLAGWLVERSQECYLTWEEIVTHATLSNGRQTDPWGLDLDRVRTRYHQIFQAEPTLPPPTAQPTFTDDGIPISDGFDFPVGPRGENVNVWDTNKVDVTLVDPQYFKVRNAWHTGEDWNGRGGGDTDLGDPVYAISKGRVVEAGYYVPSWGNIVLLEHALPNGTRVWSQYAHLNEILVGQAGQLVERGQQIGTIGKGQKTEAKPNGLWVAHLHFEIRKKSLPIDAWRPYVDSREQVLANYHQPTTYINEHRPQKILFAAGADKRPVILVDAPTPDPAMGSFSQADVPNWYTAPYGYQGTMLWTFAAAQQEANWAEWQPKLPVAGQWEVWVYIPSDNATTRQARYTISHADGVTQAFVDQNSYYNEWVRLGKYYCQPGQGTVRLSDLTGERTRNIKVGFDAVRWVKIGE